MDEEVFLLSLASIYLRYTTLCRLSLLSKKHRILHTTVFLFHYHNGTTFFTPYCIVSLAETWKCTKKKAYFLLQGKKGLRLLTVQFHWFLRRSQSGNSSIVIHWIGVDFAHVTLAVCRPGQAVGLGGVVVSNLLSPYQTTTLLLHRRPLLVLLKFMMCS